MDSEYQEFLRLEEVVSRLKRMRKIQEEKEWRSQMEEFLVNLPSFDQSLSFRELVRGELAQNLSSAYYLHKERGKAEEFRKILEDFFVSHAEQIPNSYRVNDTMRAGKRQPGLVETVIETVERFRQIEKVAEVFSEVSRGMIVGGSMMYGPFYNIRAETEQSAGSDIDAIFVIRDDAWNEDAWLRVCQTNLFQEGETTELFSRLVKFLELR